MFLVLDTTVLVKQYRLNTRMIESLATLAESKGFTLAVTSIGVEETVAKYERDMPAKVQAVENARTEARKLGVTLQVDDLVQQLEEAKAGYRSHLTKRLADLRIAVLPVADVDHMTLVIRSTDRRRPCKPDGTGYRDTLNWFTLMKLAQDNPGRQIYWITSDADFWQGKDIHPDLIDDLEERTLPGRIRFAQELEDIAPQLEKEYMLPPDGSEQWRDLTSRAGAAVLEELNTGRDLDPVRCGLPLSVIGAPATLTRARRARNVVLTRLDPDPEVTLVPFAMEFKATCALNVTDGANGQSTPWLDEDGQPRKVKKTLIARGYLEVKDHQPRVVDLRVSAAQGDPAATENLRTQTRLHEVSRLAAQMSDFDRTTFSESLRLAAEHFRTRAETSTIAQLKDELRT